MNKQNNDQIINKLMLTINYDIINYIINKLIIIIYIILLYNYN